MGILKSEPVAIAAFLSIAINLAVSFGLHLSADQIALINALVVAGLALVVRQSVYAPATVQKLADKAASTGNRNIGSPPSGDKG